MIVYNQKIKDGPEKIYLGEDTLPYNNDCVLLVADGLGGRGGYPHKKVSPMILDREGFIENVFGDIFSAGADEDFKEYVLGCFNEVFDTSSYYFRDENTMRSSGYFASRLAGILALHDIKYTRKFSKENLFSMVYSTEDIDKTVQDYAADLGEVLREKLEYAAEKLNLEIETSLSGAYLLPTTLCIALTNESEKFADVIFIWAGDSRGYALTRTGLKQITADHEENETMNNLVSLSRPFKLEGRFVRIPKPCAVFCASDGCYKCSGYSSPLEMEMTVLNAVHLADGYREMGRKLEDEYKKIGRHDDSNSMAMRTFGLKTFNDFKLFADERLNWINSNYVSVLPDIFETDYRYESEKLKSDVDRVIYENSSDWLARANIKQYACEKMKECGYEPYVKGIAPLLEEKDKQAREYRNFVYLVAGYIKASRALLNYNVENLSTTQIRDLLLSGKLAAGVNSESINRNINGNLERYYRELIARENRYSALIGEMNRIEMECTERFIRVRRKDIESAVWENRAKLLSPEEIKETENRAAELKNSIGEMNLKIEKCSEIYSAYEKGYKEYYREAKI